MYSYSNNEFFREYTAQPCDNLWLLESDDLIVTDIVHDVWITFGFLPLHKLYESLTGQNIFITVCVDNKFKFLNSSREIIQLFWSTLWMNILNSLIIHTSKSKKGYWNIQVSCLCMLCMKNSVHYWETWLNIFVRK